MLARPGSGLEPPGLAGLFVRRSLRYADSHALCGSRGASDFVVVDGAKNLRPEDRLLWPVVGAGRGPVCSDFIAEAPVGSARCCSYTAFLCSKLIAGA